MDFLFFDIECCDGKHICEFGYVLTDMNFNVIEQDVIPMNPEKPFYLSRGNDRGDLELFFSDTKYFLSPKFPEYHKRIKSLIEAPDRLVVGYAITNDAKFLRTACIRYELEPINFSFCDSQMIYDKYKNSEKSTSLENAVNDFQLPPPEFYHRSDCDAYATMLIVKELCNRLEIPPEKLFERCEYSLGRIDGKEITVNAERLKYEKQLLEVEDGTISNTQGRKLLVRFVHRVEKTEDLELPEIAGKSICFDGIFEREHLKEAFSIAQRITNAGGKYEFSVEHADVLVNSASVDPAENAKLRQAIEKKVPTIGLAEIYRMMNTTPEEMVAYPMPDIEVIMKTVNSEPEPKMQMTAGDNTRTTLGDIFKRKGIVFSE